MVAVQSPFACSRARLRCATSDGASGALDRSEAEAPVANLHADNVDPDSDSDPDPDPDPKYLTQAVFHS